jgi:hypothetical protein
MKITVKENCLVITREKGDTKYTNSGWSTAESKLLYHIKEKLNSQGYDLIKKRMWKDGHLVDNEQQYLRTRNKNSKCPHIYIYNSSWQVYDAGRDLMEKNETTLSIVRDIFNK